jgi:hypothetical protein
MKHTKKICTTHMGPHECPAQDISNIRVRRSSPSLVIRTERRSWFILAITGFGALLLRYWKSIRERSEPLDPLLERRNNVETRRRAR